MKIPTLQDLVTEFQGVRYGARVYQSMPTPLAEATLKLSESVGVVSPFEAGAVRTMATVDKAIVMVEAAATSVEDYAVADARAAMSGVVNVWNIGASGVQGASATVEGGMLKLGAFLRMAEANVGGSIGGGAYLNAAAQTADANRQQAAPPPQGAGGAPAQRKPVGTGMVGSYQRTSATGVAEQVSGYQIRRFQ